MKKIIFVLLIIILIIISIIATVTITANIQAKLKEDSLKFKAEYEELNETKQTIEIPDNNPMRYIDVKEAVEILKNGTGIMYIGYPACPSCREAVPCIIEAAKEAKIKKIYYLNITTCNNAFKVENGEIVKTRTETEGYYELLEEAKEATREYFLHEAQQEYLVDEPRIFSPTVLKIEKGEIVKFKVGTSIEEENNELSREEMLKQEYIEIMK